ncbi:SAM-dependent methyltransferase, partial [Gordonia sp. NPDC003585]
MSRTTTKAHPGRILPAPGAKRAGRILFVGSGPGDPELLTVRARTVIANATTAYIDPDVPAAVVNLIGSAHREEPAADNRRAKSPLPEVRAERASKGADSTDTENSTAPVDSDETTDDADAIVHPALGDPTEVAKTLVAAAKAGDDVVRVVSGDPLTTDSVLTEVNAVARTSIAFEVLPGLPAASVVPSYAGM